MTELVSDADKIKDLEKQVRKWKAKTADIALAMSLLKEAAERLTSTDETWLETRWVPGLKLLHLDAGKASETSEDE